MYYADMRGYIPIDPEKPVTSWIKGVIKFYFWNYIAILIACVVMGTIASML